MGKYRNNNNTSRTQKGLVWGLSAAGITYAIVQLLHIFSGIQKMNELQKQQPYSKPRSYIVFRDSTGKKDTVLMDDYVKMDHPPPFDTLYIK